MPEISVRIPALGEGLQEARIVALLKQPGDTIKRDEYIYQMETDKAVMDVESPHAGTLVKWLVSVDDVVPIGGEVLIINTNEAGATSAPEPEPATPAAAGSNTIALKIPQIGEGIQEARLVAHLKQPGDEFKRDEILYQMETDKAVMDVESPYKGKIVRWLAEVDDVIPVGGDVLLIETEEAAGTTTEQPASPSTQASPSASASTPVSAPVSGERRRDIPPRTRAYAKEKGLSDADLQGLPITGKNLLPADIDSYLSQSRSQGSQSDKKFSEQAMGGKQRILSSRLARGSKLVVPGMMSVVCNWGELESLRAEIKASGSDFQPSSFTMFAYAVARAAAKHPIMRSTMIGDDTIRTYDHLQLGIAVALPGDQLVVAVVPNSDTLTWKEFAEQARESINLARDGKDQADESVTLSITNMQGHGIREAMAVVVPPGVATIFLGEVYNGLAEGKELQLQRCANIGITIDHRLINGVGGADYLNEIKSNVENIRELCK